MISFLSLIYSRDQSERNYTQNDRGYKAVASGIKLDLEEGRITQNQANQRYKDLEAKLKHSGVRGPRDNSILTHFEKLGVNDLDNIKKSLLENGITDVQMESVLGGMIRMLSSMKSDPNRFILNSRIKKYFRDNCGLNSNQIDYIEKLSMQIIQQ